MGAGASAAATVKSRRREKVKIEWQELIIGSEWLPADPRIGEPFDPVTGSIQITQLRQSHLIKQVIVDPAVKALESKKGLGGSSKKKCDQMIMCIHRVSQMMFVDSDFLEHCFNMLGGYLEPDPVDPGGMKLLGQQRQFVICTPLGKAAIQQEDKVEQDIRNLCKGRYVRDLVPTERKLLENLEGQRYKEPVPRRTGRVLDGELGKAKWSPCECGKCKDCDGDRRCQTCANCARCLLCGPARPTGVWHNGIKWLKSNVDGVERAVRNKWAVYVNGLGCGFLQSADNELGILDLLIEQKSLGNLSKASVQAVRFKYMGRAKLIIAHLNALGVRKVEVNGKGPMDFDMNGETIALTPAMCNFTEVETSNQTVKVGWGKGLGAPAHVDWLIREDINFIADEKALLREITECEVRVSQTWHRERSESTHLAGEWKQGKRVDWVGIWQDDLLAKTRWAKKQTDRERAHRAKDQWQSQYGDLPEEFTEEFREFKASVDTVEIPRSKEREIVNKNQARVKASITGLLRPRQKDLTQEQASTLATLESMDSNQMSKSQKVQLAELQPESLIEAVKFPMLKQLNIKNRRTMVAHVDKDDQFLTDEEMRLWISVLNYGDPPTDTYMEDIYKKMQQHRLKRCPDCEKSHRGTTCPSCGG